MRNRQIYRKEEVGARNVKYLSVSGAKAHPPPLSGPWSPPSRGVWVSHTTTHHNRQDSSGREISPTHRPLSDNTQHNNRQISIPPMGFETAISAGERTQTDALERAGTGTDRKRNYGARQKKMEVFSTHFP